MLSYQHAYHAGGPADLVKHAVLLAVLARLKAERRTVHYVETHAGRGLYDLQGAMAARTGEHAEGILKLLAAGPLPPALERLREAVARRQGPGGGPLYPGSPALALDALGPEDRLFLCERHPKELEALKAALEKDPRVRIAAGDGLALAPAALARRHGTCVLLVDPSYEEKADYARMAPFLAGLDLGARRAIALLWCPLMADGRERPLLGALGELGLPCLLVALRFGGGPARLAGSAMAVLRPPGGLEGTLRRELAPLAPLLARGEGASLAVALDRGVRTPSGQARPDAGEEGQAEQDPQGKEQR